MKKTQASVAINLRYIYVLVALVSILLMLGGYLYYSSVEKSITKSKHEEIEAITNMKIGQITQWRKDRNGDSRVFSQSTFFTKGINRWLNKKNDKNLEKQIITRIALIEDNYGYEDVFLCSVNGELLLSANPGENKCDSLLKLKIVDAVKNSQIVFSDFYYCNTHKKIHYDIIAPVFDDYNNTIAVLVFRVDPNVYLYPLIQSWPTPSKTSETLIVRKDGDSVLFLSKLRLQKNTVLKFRISLTEKDVPAVQAVLGFKGIFDGTDYRGVKVLTYIVPIPGTPWSMVTKVDKSEIYSELHFIAISISLFTFVLIVLAGVGFALVFKVRQKNIYQELLNKEKELRANQEEYRTTLYCIGDAVITAELNGTIHQMNPVAEQLTGWWEAEVIGMPIDKVFMIINEVTRNILENPVEAVLNGGVILGLANHTLLISRDGKEIPIAYSGAPIKNESGEVTGVVLVFHDQSDERKKIKELIETQESFRAIFENNAAAIAIIETDATIFMVNNAFCRITGFSEKEAIGKKWTQQISPDDLERLTEYNQRRLSNSLDAPDKYEFSFYRKDGEVRYGLMSVSMIQNPRKIITSFIDITGRKQAEEALQKSEIQVRRKLEAILSPDLDISTLELSDIIDSDAIQGLMNEFYQLTNVGIGIIDLNGKVLVKTGWQDICAKYHRINPESCQLCLESDLELSRNVQSGTFKKYLCKNNMWDLATPIIVGDRHMGNIFLGQFLFEDEAIDYQTFREQASHYGFNEQEYIAALERVPRWSHEMVNAAMSFYAAFAQIIGDLSYSNIKLANSLEERKRSLESLVESEEKFRNLFDHSPVGKSMTGVDGSLYVNKSFCDIVGYSEEELKTISWMDISHPDDLQLNIEVTQSLLKGEISQARFEKRYIHKDGHIVWTDVTTYLQRDKDGNPQFFITTILDITERKQALEEIKRFNDELEQRVMERTAQLEAANDELEAFSYSVSHDLRAPLRHIVGYIDLLTSHFPDSIPEKGKHYLHTIVDSAKQMGLLIDDLLQFSRTGRQEMRKANFDMNSILLEVLSTLDQDIKSRDIHWVIPALPHVFCDYNLLKLVWFNLLSNALKFTQKKEETTIEIGFQEEDNEFVFYVRDNGVGFDMQYVHKLFGVFQRLHSDQEFEGTGIGLANVHRIIQRHGGRTWAEAEQNKGATFYFTLLKHKEKNP